VSELSQLVDAQQDFVERLQRGEADARRDVALQQRVLEVLRAAAEKDSPLPRRNPRELFARAHGASNLFALGVAASHRRNVLGRAITGSKHAFVVGLRPFHVELLRPQQLFNEQFLRFAEQLLDPAAGTQRALLASMARQTLTAVEAPHQWQVKSHRKALIGRSVDAAKRWYLSTVRPAVEPVLARQHAWNQAAIRALQLALAPEPVPLVQIHLLLGELAQLSELPVRDRLPKTARSTFPLWIELFRRQREFNNAVTLLFTALFDLPLPPDDGRLAAYPLSVMSQEQRRITEVARQVRHLRHRPLISIIVPVWETPEAVLRSCIDSVLAQSYENWELCIVDDGSRSPDVRTTLSDYTRRDPRIRVKHCFNNRGIARATNEALGLARGEFVAFLDHDDEICPHALGEVALFLNEQPDTDFLYTDEDRLDLRGQRMLPFFKPDWSPDLLRACNYVCHFLVARRSLVDEVGRIRPGFDGAQDYDLVLRMSERACRIGHIPQILYHWRATPQSTAHNLAAKPAAAGAGVRALQEHLERSGEQGRIETPIPTIYRVRYELPHPPKVSLIIATERGGESFRRLLSSIDEITDYDARELVICHQTSSIDVPTKGLVRRARVRAGAKLPEAHQLGASIAQGKVLIFLHEDLVAVDPGWVRELVGHAMRPGVGVVGPKLVYPDGTIAHAGFVVGGVTNPISPFAHMADMNEWTTMGSPNWTRNYLAVSGTCMAMRHSTWEGMSGFDQELSPDEAAIDFCLRVRERGSRIVFTPHTKLVNWSAVAASPGSKNPSTKPAVEVDPYYNPNLSTRVTNGRVRVITTVDM
jgi:GT2 family glycosyltransferase